MKMSSSKRVKLLNSVLEKKIKTKKSQKKKKIVKEPEIITDQETDSVEHYVLEYSKDEEVSIIKTEEDDDDDDKDKDNGKNNTNNADDHENNADDDDDDDDDNEDDDNKTELNADTSNYPSEDDVKSVQEVLEHVCGKCYKCFSSFQHFVTHSMYCKNDGEIAKNIAKMLENLEAVEQESLELEKQNICICCKESLETAHSGHIRCPKCPKSFKNSPSFERHLCLIHSDSLDYPCETCNAKCPSSIILDLHRKAHLRGKPFACKKCGEEFTRKYHLNRHHLYSGCETNNVTKKIVLCKVCGKEFYRLDNLRMHLKQHLGQDTKSKDYPCPYCGKAFYGTATLNIHIRTHTGERPFTCDLCGNSFPSNPALRKHRRTHTGERPYQCSKCLRAFAAKEVLNRHMKTHTGEKPHGCDICGKRFIQATQLKQHLVTHQKKGSVKVKDLHLCRKCKSEFKTKEELIKHMKEKCPSIKQEKCEISCNHCGKILHTEGGLKRHITRVHVQKDMIDDNVRSVKKAKINANYICDICHEVFDNHKNLEFHHLKEHDGTDEFEITEQIVVEDADEENIVIQEKVIEEEEDDDEIMLDEQQNKEDYDNIIQLSEEETKCRFCNKNFHGSKKFIKHMEDDHGAIILSVDNNQQKNENQNDNDDPLSSNDIKISIKEEKSNETIEIFHVADIFDDAGVNTSNNDDGMDINEDSDNEKNKQEQEQQKIDKIHKKSPNEISNNKNNDNKNDDNDNEDDSDDEDNYVLIKLKKPKENKNVTSPTPSIKTMEENLLTENILQLLDLLVDKDILEKFGYPKAPVEEVLLKVIESCGHSPKKNNNESSDYMTRLRDYVKLLFTIVIDNDSIKELLNNHPVDKVIHQVLENKPYFK